MAEQATAGATPEPQTDAQRLQAKQQVGLAPGVEASTSAQTLPGFVSTPGFTLPATPTLSQAKQGGTTAGHESSHESTPSSTPYHQAAMSHQPLHEQQLGAQLLCQETPSIAYGQPLQQRVASRTSGEDSRTGHAPDLAFKDWQGPLYVLSHKGEELICHLKTGTWPAHLPRYVYTVFGSNARGTSLKLWKTSSTQRRMHSPSALLYV